MTNPKFSELKQRLAEVNNLTKAAGLLFWDQRVMMPPGGSAARAEAIATVSQLAQERFISPEIGRLLEDLRGFEEESGYDSIEASLIRVARRDYDKATRVPPELVGDLNRASATALSAWGPAKEQSNFELLRPHLEKNLELRQRYVACFEPADETYDVLLDNFEPNMKTAEVREIFDGLKEELAPLVREIADAGDVDDSFLHQEFDPNAQRAFSMEVLRRFGYTDEEWRLDQTPHPFMSTPGQGDIRLTTNFRPDDLSSVFATMHEFGHGIYEWGAAGGDHRRHDPRVRRLARAPRVSEPNVGEPRRSQPLVLAVLLPEAPAVFPHATRGCGRRGLHRAVKRSPVPDQDRRRRGDVQPAHHSPLRARAGADRQPRGSS